MQYYINLSFLITFFFLFISIIYNFNRIKNLKKELYKIKSLIAKGNLARFFHTPPKPTSSICVEKASEILKDVTVLINYLQQDTNTDIPAQNLTRFANRLRQVNSPSHKKDLKNYVHYLHKNGILNKKVLNKTEYFK